MRPDVFNEDGELEDLAPKVYEAIKGLESLREIVTSKMQRYNQTYSGKNMNLVLFNDALKYLMRISRIIQMERGCALLVGVGGSGKQSLTKLAAFIAN